MTYGNPKAKIVIKDHDLQPCETCRTIPMAGIADIDGKNLCWFHAFPDRHKHLENWEYKEWETPV